MVGETVEWAAVRPGGRYIDATLGGGGHAAAVLEASAPGGRLLGIDADPAAVARARRRFASHGPRFRAVHGRFSRLRELAAVEGFEGADAVILDLGMSSDQLDDPGRGFGFDRDGPLDMRLDPGQPLTAADIVNTWPEEELADLLRRYGEEPAARRIARCLVTRRRQAPFLRTADLAATVAVAVGRRGPRHPATATFRALRMAVNRELEELVEGLEAGLATLRIGGRLVAISFHSLEDRAVKRCFREHAPRAEARPEGGTVLRFRPPAVRVLTRHGVTPSPEEVWRNPRARSARLRAAERMPEPCCGANG